MTKKSTTVTLRKLENRLKVKKISFQRSGQLITASKKKKAVDGKKVEIRLTLEKLETGPIVGYVRGLGKSLIAVPPEMAITAYHSRLTLLK